MQYGMNSKVVYHYRPELNFHNVSITILQHPEKNKIIDYQEHSNFTFGSSGTIHISINR